MKDKITKWYSMGLWTKEMVLNAVAKGVISEDEANEICEVKTNA